MFCVSSSSSLTRQQRPQPSHRLSHSASLISSRLFARQNGTSSTMGHHRLARLSRSAAASLRPFFPGMLGRRASSQLRRNPQVDCHVLVPRTRSSHTLAANPIANFGFKRGTRIIVLLVSL